MAIASENSEFIRDLMKTLKLDGTRLIGFTLRAHVNEPVKIETEEWASPLKDGSDTIIRNWIITREEKTINFCKQHKHKHDYFPEVITI